MSSLFFAFLLIIKFEYVLILYCCCWISTCFDTDFNTDSAITYEYQCHPCSCIEDYKRGADGRTCLPLSESCTEGVDCGETAGTPANQTTFGDVFYGYDNRTKEITTGQILKATFR